MEHHETLVKHCETFKTSWNIPKTLWNIMKHSVFDVTISALNAATSVLSAALSALRRLVLELWWYRLGVAISALSTWQYQRPAQNFHHICHCGVGITPQMCNRATNSWDMGIFFQTWGHGFHKCEKYNYLIIQDAPRIDHPKKIQIKRGRWAAGEIMGGFGEQIEEGWYEMV